MFDASWCKSRVSSFSESRWQTFKIFDLFEETLKDARAVWQDSAGREIDAKYLVPQAIESSVLRKSVEEHEKNLKQCTDQMGRVSDLITSSRSVSSKVAEIMRHVEDEIGEVYAHCETCQRATTEASLKIGQVKQILSSV